MEQRWSRVGAKACVPGFGRRNFSLSRYQMNHSRAFKEGVPTRPNVDFVVETRLGSLSPCAESLIIRMAPTVRAAAATPARNQRRTLLRTGFVGVCRPLRDRCAVS